MEGEAISRPNVFVLEPTQRLMAKEVEDFILLQITGENNTKIGIITAEQYLLVVLEEDSIIITG